MKISQIKLNLKKILANFGSVTTDKGTLEYVGEELTEGVEAFIEGEVAPDGDYVAEDGTVVTVEAGLVKSIKAPEAEVVEAEETEPGVDQPDYQSQIDEIRAQLDKLVEIVDQVATKMAEIEAKLAEPVEKTAEEVMKAQTKDKGLFR